MRNGISEVVSGIIGAVIRYGLIIALYTWEAIGWVLCHVFHVHARYVLKSIVIKRRATVLDPGGKTRKGGYRQPLIYREADVMVHRKCKRCGHVAIRPETHRVTARNKSPRAPGEVGFDMRGILRLGWGRS